MKLFLVLAITVTTSLGFAADKEIRKRVPASTTYKVHACELDALKKAESLLRLHFDNDSYNENIVIDPKVTLKAPIKVAVGKGKLDVLEVLGSIQKTTFRMRFIYAQNFNFCALMGQEIFELSNPY